MLVLVVLVLVVVFGFASLAMDYGRVQVAKTELRRAADSAARAGAWASGRSRRVQQLASEFAGQNTVRRSPVTLDWSTDVEFGTWDKSRRTFTTLTGSSAPVPTRCAVTCRRVGDNAIPLVAGGCSASRSATWKPRRWWRSSPPGFGLVGLDFIQLKGNSTASYWSSTGSVGGNAATSPPTATSPARATRPSWGRSGRTHRPW